MEDNTSVSSEDASESACNEEFEDTPDFASREEFDPFLSLQYKVNELEEELKAKVLYEKHLLWHCLMYREALKKLPNGCQSLRDTLVDFTLNESTFLQKCACCEHEYYKKILQDLQEKNKQPSRGESQLNVEEKRCPSCCVDDLLLQIRDQFALLVNESDSESISDE